MELASLIASILAIAVSAIASFFAYTANKKFNTINLRNERTKALIEFCSFFEVSSINRNLAYIKNRTKQFRELKNYVGSCIEKYNIYSIYLDKNAPTIISKLLNENINFFNNDSDENPSFFRNGNYQLMIENDQHIKTLLYEQIDIAYVEVKKYSENRFFKRIG